MSPMLPLSPRGERAETAVPAGTIVTHHAAVDPPSNPVDILADSKLLDKLSDVAMVQDAAALR